MTDDAAKTPPPPTPRDPAALALARGVATAVKNAGGRAFLVGGCVRDALLGRACQDLDVEVYGVAADRLVLLLRALGRVDAVGRAFGVLKLSHGGATIDVALPRTERKTGVGHRGFAVDSDPDLDPAVAASRRDLTVNAILEDPLTGEIVDPWNGRADLANGVLRHVSPAFAEDPLRVLRVVQFAARFEFAIAPETAAFCRAIDLGDLPIERVAHEIENWLVLGSRPSLGLAALATTGAERLIPELALDSSGMEQADRARREDRARRIGARLDAAVAFRSGRQDPTAFMLAALLASLPGDDPLAPNAVAIGQRLARIAFGNARQRLAAALAREIPAARELACGGAGLARPALRRLALRVPLDPLCALLAAEEAAFGGDATAANLRAIAKEENVLDRPPAPLLHGRDLMALGAPPGVGIGVILDRIFERQLDGEFPDVEAARAAAQELLGAATEPGDARTPDAME